MFAKANSLGELQKQISGRQSGHSIRYPINCLLTLEIDRRQNGIFVSLGLKTGMVVTDKARRLRWKATAGRVLNCGL